MMEPQRRIREARDLDWRLKDLSIQLVERPDEPRGAAIAPRARAPS
jgi:hypothetical protein